MQQEGLGLSQGSSWVPSAEKQLTTLSGPWSSAWPRLWQWAAWAFIFQSSFSLLTPWVAVTFQQLARSIGAARLRPCSSRSASWIPSPWQPETALHCHSVNKCTKSNCKVDTWMSLKLENYKAFLTQIVRMHRNDVNKGSWWLWPPNITSSLYKPEALSRSHNSSW